MLSLSVPLFSNLYNLEALETLFWVFIEALLHSHD